MLSESEFVEQQRVLGCRIHKHDGEFWEETYPFYCRPAFAYKIIEKGAARPACLHSLLGYSHQVPRLEHGNRTLTSMALERNHLEGFSLQKLPSKKRNQVRRAMDKCLIQPILDIEMYLERIREINLSQAIRQENGAGAETSAKRYTEEADAWRTQIRREFTVGVGREWWGAFVDGNLAAYIRTYQVDSIRVIQQAKADSAYFKSYPMDALYFTLLSKATEDSSCQCIVNGSPLHKSVNHFKKQFLFREVTFPCYSSNAWLLEAVKWLIHKRPRRTSTVTVTYGVDDDADVNSKKDVVE